MVNNTFGLPHTNFVIMAPLAATNQPIAPVQTNQAIFSSQMTCLGNAVWVDDNLNGLPDENLALRGLNNVRVQLFRIEIISRFLWTKSGRRRSAGFVDDTCFAI
jgi:hypothetical protein